MCFVFEEIDFLKKNYINYIYSLMLLTLNCYLMAVTDDDSCLFTV